MTNKYLQLEFDTSSTPDLVDATEQEAEQRLSFLANEANFALGTAIRYYTCEEIHEWWIELTDDTTANMVVEEAKARRDVLLQEEGNRNVHVLAAFVNAFLSNPQEWQRNFLTQQVSIRVSAAGCRMTVLEKNIAEYAMTALEKDIAKYMAYVPDWTTPLMLSAPFIETATIAAMNKTVTTPAVIELGPVTSWNYTQVLPVPSQMSSAHTLRQVTTRTFSLKNITGEESEFVINTTLLTGHGDNLPPVPIIYSAAEEQSCNFANDEVSLSEDAVVIATIPFNIQRFGTPKKGDRKMKKNNLDLKKIEELRKKIEVYEMQAREIKLDDEQIKEIVDNGNLKIVEETIESHKETIRSTEGDDGEILASQYAVAAVLEIDKQIYEYFNRQEQVACENATKNGKITVKTVEETADLAHVVAEREGDGINMLGVDLKERKFDSVTYCQKASLTWNRISRAVELGIGGLTLDTKVLSGILPTDSIITRYCPNLVMLKILGRNGKHVNLYQKLWSRAKKMKAEILIADKDNTACVFVQDVHGDDPDKYIPFVPANREQEILNSIEEYQDISEMVNEAVKKATEFKTRPDLQPEAVTRAEGKAAELKAELDQVKDKLPKGMPLSTTEFVSQAGRQVLFTGKRCFAWYVDHMPADVDSEEFWQYAELIPEANNVVKSAVENGKSASKIKKAAYNKVRQLVSKASEKRDGKRRWMSYLELLEWANKYPRLLDAIKESLEAQITTVQEGMTWFYYNAPEVHATWMNDGIPTTRSEIIEWADTVSRVRHEDWLASPGMLKKHETLVSVDRVDKNGNTVKEIDWDAVYRYVTGGITGHLAKYRKGVLSTKKYAQDSARPGHTFAPARLYEKTLPSCVGLTPFKFGDTTDGQYLADARFLQRAFNTSLRAYYFTLNACVGYSGQAHMGFMSIKGVSNFLYPFMLRLIVRDHIKLANEAEHHPDMKPDNDGNYIVRLVAGQLSDKEEGELFKWRDGAKDALWKGCLVFEYDSEESRDARHMPEIFADFNSYKVSCEGKDVKDKDGHVHKCMTGLHLMAGADKKDMANISSQSIVGDIAVAPKAINAETMSRLHESLEKKLNSVLNLTPSTISARDLETRMIMDVEGDLIEIVPDYNDLTTDTAPQFGRLVYQADGHADLNKLTKGIGSKIRDFKIPMPAHTYFLACDPAHMFGGKGVLRTFKGHLEVFVNEKPCGQLERLYRFPKARFNDSLWVKVLSLSRYVTLVMNNKEMDFTHKLISAVYAARITPGVLCLPNVPDVFTTIGGADTDGDHVRKVRESAEIRAKVVHGMVLEKPKDDLQAYLNAHEEYVNAVRNATVDDAFLGYIQQAIAEIETWLAKAKADLQLRKAYYKAYKAAKEATEHFEQAKSFGFVNERKFNDGIKRAWSEYLQAFAAAMELFEKTSSADWKTSAEMKRLVAAQRHYSMASMPKAQRAKIAYKKAKAAYDAAEQAGTMTAAIKQAYIDTKVAYDKSTAYGTALAEYKAAEEALNTTVIGKLSKAAETLRCLEADWTLSAKKLAALKQLNDDTQIEEDHQKDLEKSINEIILDCGTVTIQ